MQNPPDEQRIGILNALGLGMAAKKDEAVAFKASSGIESEWEADEAHYQGYDDANRSEFGNTTIKPALNAQVVAKSAGSTVFPNITQPYCDAISARVGDILLPTAAKNFGLKPTPIPEMLNAGAQAMPPGQPPEAAAPMVPAVPPQPGQPPGPPVPAPLSPVAQAAQDFAKMKAEATRKADKAENKLDDWLSECQFHPEMRKVLDDCVKLGSGVIKGPVPVKRKATIWRDGALVVVEEIKPASLRIDPWNLFPDPACGENIHNGSFTWERDFLSEKKLEDLKGLPGYIDSQIDLAIEKGPSNKADYRGQSVKGQYEVWYGHCQIKKEEMIAAGCDCGDEKNSYPAMITLVNDLVIRASLNPLDSGEFPYDVVPWKRRPGMPWGTGLSRQLRTPQRIVVGAARALMNNAGLGSGPQFVIRRGVKPENGIWEVKPLKFWIEDDDATGQASSPVTAVVVPMLVKDLTDILQVGMKMAEDVSGMPLLMQGQQGKAPDTVGGMQILNNNANSVLRRIARLFDSCITEPHIRRYYNWLMEYDDDPDCKGDFQIVALGSTVLVERDIQAQEMINVLNLCKDPIYEKNPKLAMNEYLKSRRFDPATFDYTEEELKEIKSRQPMPPPQIAVAQIRAASAEKIEAQRAKEDIDHAAADASLAMEEAKIKVSESEKDRQLQLVVEQVTERIKSMELSGAKEISLDTLKGMLAATSMKLSTQKQLSMASMRQADDHVIANHQVDVFKHRNPVPKQVITAPTEPAGRAQPGRSFQQ